jgi:hypothetical protein
VRHDSVVDVDEYLAVIDRALDGMAAIAGELGDGRINERAALPGANSAFALVTHCLGVCEYWLGALVAGRPVERDREAEFTATGTVVRLERMLADGRARIRADLAGYRPGAPLTASQDPRFQGPEGELTTDAVLLHVLEELAQHHGQLEVLRDVLVTAGA